MIFFKNLMRGRDKLHVTYLYERERARAHSLFLLIQSFTDKEKDPKQI